MHGLAERLGMPDTHLFIHWLPGFCALLCIHLLFRAAHCGPCLCAPHYQFYFYLFIFFRCWVLSVFRSTEHERSSSLPTFWGWFLVWEWPWGSLEKTNVFLLCRLIFFGDKSLAGCYPVLVGPTQSKHTYLPNHSSVVYGEGTPNPLFWSF